MQRSDPILGRRHTGLSPNAIIRHPQKTPREVGRTNTKTLPESNPHAKSC